MKSFKLILSLIFLFCPKKIFSQKDTINTIQLNELVITATKSEKIFEEITIPIISLNNEEIILSGYSTLNEIITEQIGMTTVQMYGGGKSIQLQGLDSDYVLILIDGLPITGRIAGDLDLSRISLNDVEKIEIIKGGSSSLYGSEAMAGVVNVITKKNYEEGLYPGFTYKYGSHKLHEIGSKVYLSKKHIKAGGNINYLRSNGYDLVDNDDTQTVQPFNRLSNSLYIEALQKNIGNIQLKIRNYLENKDETVFITKEGINPKSKTNEYNIFLKYNNKLFEKTSLFVEYYNTLFSNKETLLTNESYTNYNFNQSINKYELRLKNNSIDNINIDLGVGFNQEFVDRTNFDKKESIKSNYLYFQKDWKLNPKTNIVSGVRYDRHLEYKSQISPKVSINKNLSNKFSIKASLGTGFKTPDFRHLYLNFSNSNSGYVVLGSNILNNTINYLQKSSQLLEYSGPDKYILSPEKSMSLNIGISSYIRPSIPLEINFFRNDINNLIDTKVVGRKTNGQNIFSYFNIRKAKTYGIELTSNIEIINNLNVKLSNYHLYAKDISALNEFKNGLVFARDKITMQSFALKRQDYFGLLNRARNEFNINANYKIKKIQTNIIFNLNHKTKIGFRDTNGNSYLDKYDQFSKGHVLTNITINKKALKFLTFQVQIKNIFNHIDPSNFIINPGRTFYCRMIFGR